MRYLLALIIIVCYLNSCQPLGFNGEKAIIMAPDNSKCGYCGGWLLDINGVTYRSLLSNEFSMTNTPVWIKFGKDESTALKRTGNWIIIKSIKLR